MAEQIVGKTAVITGASSGIGVAIAKALAAEGANVVLAARNKENLNKIASEIEEKDCVLTVKTDVTKQSEVEFLVEQTNHTFGSVDIYVNNAGVVHTKPISEGNVDMWDQMIDTNIKGTLYGINAVLPAMKSRATGHIMNIASVAGIEPSGKFPVLSATKAAIRALSISLEKELAKTGVRITNISPGNVHSSNSSKNSSANERKKLEPQDIARAVVYAVNQPNYVNVNEITVRHM